MKSFKLELRVYDTNTRGWEVYLERIREDHKIEKWLPPSDGKIYYSKTWTEYTIDDDNLEVFLTCTGYGASVQCVVLINDAKPSKKNTVFSSFDDRKIQCKTFNIN